jgi:O-antigen/teichoic acid export membrane protein
MYLFFKNLRLKFTKEHLFMFSALLVNIGNYFYNLILGRFLGPEKFADATILISFLLSLSFVAMTFQLVTAKFAILFGEAMFKKFILNIYKYALFTGILLGILIIFFSSQLHYFFKTTSASMFVVFGFGVPMYFLMSVNRGVFQGKQELRSLSMTYQLEMLSRLLLTFLLLYLLDVDATIVIAIAILCSFFFGLIPFRYVDLQNAETIGLDNPIRKLIKDFFIITAFYELTQIVINNSDVLLVKHFFYAHEAGLYASLALIGRDIFYGLDVCNAAITCRGETKKAR